MTDAFLYLFVKYLLSGSFVSGHGPRAKNVPVIRTAHFPAVRDLESSGRDKQ